MRFKIEITNIVYTGFKWGKTILVIILVLQQGLSQGLENDDLEIIKTFDAQLVEAEKINIQPLIQPVTPIKKSYKFNITIAPLEIKYPDPVIKAIAAEPESPVISKYFYGKLGYGNVKNPKADIGYYFTDENKLDYYIRAYHYGFNNDKNLKDQSMATSLLSAGTKYRLKENLQVKADLNFHLDKRKFFYVFIPSPLNPNEDIGRNRIIGALNAVVSNVTQTSSGIDFAVGGSYSMLNISNDKKSEVKAGLEVMASKSKASWKFELPVYLNTVLQTGIHDLYSVQFIPNIRYQSKKLWFKVALSLFNDRILKTKVWPGLHFDYALMGKNLHFFASTSQIVFSNDLHHLSKLNPWLDSKLSEVNNNLLQKIAAGFKGETNSVGYEVELSFGKIYNQAIFTNRFKRHKAETSFTNSDVFAFKFNADLALSQNMRLGGNLIKNFYSNHDFEKLYGINTFILNTFLKMEFLRQRLEVKPIFEISDNLYSRITSGDLGAEDVKLNHKADLSIHTEMKLNQKTGFYVEVNNVFNNKYSIAYGYPGLGFHLHGGITLKI